MGRRVGAACWTDKVGSSGRALHRASEADRHTAYITRRGASEGVPMISYNGWFAVRTSFLRTDTLMVLNFPNDFIKFPYNWDNIIHDINKIYSIINFKESKYD